MFDLRFVASIAERDIDLVILEELSVSDEFRDWISARVHGAPKYGSFIGAWHSVSDASLGESDLAFAFTSESGERVVLLIENKIDARPQPEQGARYKQRGEKGVRAGDWDTFRTCVLAPQKYLGSTKNSELYDVSIAYEEVLAFFLSRRTRDSRFGYKAKIIQEAIEQNRRGYQPEYSAAMTAFVKDYHDFAVQNFPDLFVQEAKPRPSGSTWIMFNPPDLPAKTSLAHQLTNGVVKLIFSGSAHSLESVQAAYASIIGNGMEIAPAGKSAAISVPVPVIDPLAASFESQRERVLEALKATSRLVAMLRSRGTSIA